MKLAEIPHKIRRLKDLGAKIRQTKELGPDFSRDRPRPFSLGLLPVLGQSWTNRERGARLDVTRVCGSLSEGSSACRMSRCRQHRYPAFNPGQARASSLVIAAEWARPPTRQVKSPSGWAAEIPGLRKPRRPGQPQFVWCRQKSVAQPGRCQYGLEVISVEKVWRRRASRQKLAPGLYFHA
jgi:hypothetical protein